MRKQLLLLPLLGYIITILLAACGTGASSANASDNEIHMNTTNFVQTATTIKKGQSITLVDDALVTPHIISNGTWENGVARPTREADAPVVKDVQINGNSSATIGPFTTAGVFKFYCTIHPGMNLAVTVQ